MEEAKSRGMKVESPRHLEIISCDPVLLDEKIRLSANKNCEFLLCIHSATDEEMHCNLNLFFVNFLARIKLSERRNSIITQNILSRTVKNVVLKGLPGILTNIVNKTNVKLRGLNYTLFLDNRKFLIINFLTYIKFSSAKILDDGVLFIGIGVSQSNWTDYYGSTNGTSNGNIGNGNGHQNSHNSSATSDEMIDSNYRFPPLIIGVFFFKLFLQN